MTRKRSFQPDDKVAIIRRHLVEGVPVSDLCDELSIKPTQYYAWQKQFFENGGLAHNSQSAAMQPRNRTPVEEMSGRLVWAPFPTSPRSQVKKP